LCHPESVQYALRPSILTADTYAPYMRARQSVWMHWIAEQGWPVPPEFRATKAAPSTEAAPHSPNGDPPSQKESRRGTDKEIADAIGVYLKELKETENPNEDIACEFVLAKTRFPDAGRDRVREFYRDAVGHENLHRGRPKKSRK
jgi:hypothetical protein